MQHLGPLIFGSDGDVVQFLKDKCLLSSDHHCPRCFEEMRINQFTLFISANVNLGGQVLQLGKNPLVKNTPPILLNVSWAAYSSQYPIFWYIAQYFGNVVLG